MAVHYFRQIHLKINITSQFWEYISLHEREMRKEKAAKQEANWIVQQRLQLFVHALKVQPHNTRKMANALIHVPLRQYQFGGILGTICPLFISPPFSFLVI
jgi:hypothetical protein